MAADRWMQAKLKELLDAYGADREMSINALLLRAMEEQRERDCRAVCTHCACIADSTARFPTELEGNGRHVIKGDGASWDVPCLAATIRRGGE